MYQHLSVLIQFIPLTRCDQLAELQDPFEEYNRHSQLHHSQVFSSMPRPTYLPMQDQPSGKFFSNSN